MRNLSRVSVLFFACAELATPAWVLATPQLEEIVVTAQLREQSLQDVPVAITAFDVQTMQERNFRDFASYLSTVPGATLQELGTLGNEVKLRGLGNGTAEVSPTTAVYLGEVPIIHTGRGVNSSYNFWIVDLDRIEVLRGPQGQLYGSNSLGGAIEYVPQVAQLDEMEILGSATTSDTNHGDYSPNGDITVNLPLVQDVFGVRLTGYAARQGGWYDNVYSGGLPLATMAAYAPPLLPPPAPPFPGATLPLVLAATPGAAEYELPANYKEDVNQTDIYGGRLMANWVINERFLAGFMTAYEKQDTDGVVFAESIPYNPGRIPGTSVVENTELEFLSIPVPSTSNYKDYQFSDPLDSGNSDEIFLANLVLEYEFDFATLISSSSYWDRTAARDFDFSYGLSINVTGGGDMVPGLIHQHDNPSNLSQEFRLTSKGESRLSWLAGFFYQEIEQDYKLEVNETSPYNLPGVAASLFAPPGFPPPPPYLSLQRGNFTDEQIAVFGELAYDLTGTVNVAFSFRYFDLSQDASQFTDGTGPFQVGKVQSDNSDDQFTPKINLKWTPDESSMYYATAAEGFRTGVVNKVASPVLCGGALARLGAPDGAIRASDPDTAWNYELGAKLSLYDNRLTVNTALYHIDWSDLQTQVALFALAGEQACQTSAVLNVGDASIDGLELEVAALVTENITFDLSFSYIDGQYDDDAPEAGIVAGDTIEQTPKYSSMAGLRYGYTLARRPGFLRLEWQYVGDQEKKGLNFVNQAQPEDIGDYNQVNVRSGIEATENVSVELWVTNLFDEYGVVNAFDTGGFTVPTVQTIRPRTVGATMRFDY